MSLQPFGEDLYVLDGPTISFLGLPLPTRMALAKLRDGSIWVWSPVELTPEIENAVSGLGEVRHIIAPNKFHNMSVAQWSDRWPEARVHGAPGLAKRKPDLRVDATLTEAPDSAWAEDFDQLIFTGSAFVEEAVFFHRPTRTALLTDLVMRLEPEDVSGVSGLLARILGIVGEGGRAPLELRLSFIRRALARSHRDRLLAWEPERLLISHGTCLESGATETLSRALAWI